MEKVRIFFFLTMGNSTLKIKKNYNTIENLEEIL